MRIRIDYATRYGYERPARFIVQMLRLTPRSSEGQQVRDWRIETDVDARLRVSEDAFGNVVHSLYTDAVREGLTVRVSGEVETRDTGGVLQGGTERLSPLVYLRDTPLTQADAALRDFADEVASGATDPLEQMHRLMTALNQRIAFRIGSTTASHTAAQAFAEGAGVCQDHAQIFIACARRLGVPARYVSGHMLRSDTEDQEAAHGWAEAHIPDLGWVGFDAANGVCPTERYVRVATGLDYLGASPVRGTTYGGSGESLAVSLRVRQMQQAQRQQQSQHGQ